MFAFGMVSGGSFVFVQNSTGHIYTWADEKTAREFFESVKDKYHLYQVDSDLSHAVLIEHGGEGTGEAPPEVTPNETQKVQLFESYVYPSLLAWSPPEEML